MRAAARPLRDLMEALEAGVASSKRPYLSLAALAASTMAAWFVYVPVHELLHVAGCEASGGDVHRLTIAPLYGGGILSRFLPWIEAGGDHAGRLTGFSTGGSDLRYLATDAAPYLLTIAGGAPLLRAAARRRSAALAGVGAVLALAPFISLTGDYYEMGSILITRSLSPFEAPPEPGAAVAGVMRLRSDDLPALAGDVMNQPSGYATNVPGGATGVAAVILASFLLGVILAAATYAASAALADRLIPAAGPPAGAAARI